MDDQKTSIDESIYSLISDIHWWLDYSASDATHIKYETNIVFASHKLSDLYQVCCSARAFLHYLDNKDYGDFAKDSTSKTFVKSLMLQNALIYYNIAVDFSWQMIWLYYDKGLIGKLPTNDLYQECLKDCNYQNLLYRLTLLNEIKMKDKIVKKYFEGSKLYEEIRPKYNYLKHRGAFYFDGLGENSKSLMFSVNGKSLPKICRKELDIEEVKKLLLDFDTEFIRYCNYLIELIMPPELVNEKLEINSPLEYYHKYKDEIEKLRSKSNKEYVVKTNTKRGSN